MLPQRRDGGRNDENTALSGVTLDSGQLSTASQTSRGGLLDADIDALFDDSDLDTPSTATTTGGNSSKLASQNHPLASPHSDVTSSSRFSSDFKPQAIPPSAIPIRDPISSLFGTPASADNDLDDADDIDGSSDSNTSLFVKPTAAHHASNDKLATPSNSSSAQPVRSSTREPSLLVAQAAKAAELKAIKEKSATEAASKGHPVDDDKSRKPEAELVLVDENGRPLGTPMKTLQVAVIACVAFVNILASVIIFPFLPFFAAMFYPDVPTSKMGVYIGMLASAYFFGDVIGSLIWGRFADTYGRKPAVLIGLVTSLTGLLLFPFSPQYWVAVMIRFLSGLLCGNNSLTRTMIAEVCDDSNQHRGFSMIGLATGMARLVAPAVGGILALPAQKYPSVFKDTMFDTYPYFLPCFIGAVLTFACILAVVFFVDETLPPRPAAPSPSENEHEMVEKGAKSQNSVESEPAKSQSLLDVVTEPAILNILVVYFIHSFVGVISHEIIPMWVVNKKEDHGFEFDTTQIGTLATLVSPFQVLFQGYMYPVLAERWLYIRLFKYCAIVYGIALFFLPYVSWLAYSPTYVLWPTFIFIQGVAVCARIGAFTCIFALLSNSCDKSVRASINGIGQSVSSAGRMFGPTVAGAIFSWSLNNNMSYPFNYHCLFLLLTLCCASSYVSAMYMIPELDFQKHNAKKLLAERMASEAAKARAELTESHSYRAGSRLTHVKLHRDQPTQAYHNDDDDDDIADAPGQSLLSRPKAR